jgi:DNA-directed RNA polymerase specialized sigma24 family protein
VREYEGLCRRMAASVVGLVPDLDYDDLVQLYRVKVWRALPAYDARHRAGMTEYRWVIMCLKNYEKDLKARVRRDVPFIEDLAGDRLGDSENARLESRDAFEARLMSSSADEVYAEVEEERLLLPSTLSRLEAQIVVRLYIGFRQVDVERWLGIEKNAMTRAMRSIRRKLEDWRPPAEVLEPPAAALEIARAA